MIARNSRCSSYHVNLIHRRRRRDLSLLSFLGLQGPEHLHAGHAAPAHPLPHRPGVPQAAVRAAGGPQRARLTAATGAPAWQGPLQPGPPDAAGPIQRGRRSRDQRWSRTRPEPHVGVFLIFFVVLQWKAWYHWGGGRRGE